MKRLVRILVLVMVFSVTKISVLASEAEISFTVDGRVANENVVTLNLIIDDVKGLYAGSFSIGFNEKKVQVTEIEAGDLLNDSSIQEVKRVVDTENNFIDYAFTCLANATGIQGEGTLLKIKLKLKDTEVSKEIFSETLIKLVENSSEKLDYFNLIIDENLKESSNSSTITQGQNNSQNSQDNHLNSGGSITHNYSNSAIGVTNLKENENDKVDSSTNIKEESDNQSDNDSSTEHSSQVEQDKNKSNELTQQVDVPDKSQTTDDVTSKNDSSLTSDKTGEKSSFVGITIVSGVVLIVVVGVFIKKKYL